MHGLVKHIKSNFGIVLLSLIFLSVTPQSNADQSVEEIIKGRKALFSKNYSTAKRVQALSSNDDFDQAKKLMIEMVPVLMQEKHYLWDIRILIIKNGLRKIVFKNYSKYILPHDSPRPWLAPRSASGAGRPRRFGIAPPSP